MASAVLTFERPASLVGPILGNVTEENNRIARIEVRPGMTEGQHLGLMVRLWGDGHWTVANGEPHYFTFRQVAEAAAAVWIESGRL